MAEGPAKIIDLLTGAQLPVDKVRSFGRSESLDTEASHPDTDDTRKKLFISVTSLRDATKGRLFGLVDGKWTPIEVHRPGQAPKS